jgi:lactose/L-arabinose transport system substrate-binding protein
MNPDDSNKQAKSVDNASPSTGGVDSLVEPQPAPDTTPAPTDTSASSASPVAAPPVTSGDKGNSSKSKLLLGLVIVVVLLVLVVGWKMTHKTKVPTKAANSTTSKATVDTSSSSITVWAWSTAASALKDLIPSFNQEYPNIKVTVVDIPYNEVNPKFKTAVSNGTGFPDVMDTEGPLTSGYISSGALLDITDKATPLKDQFVAYKWSEVTKNNKIYALPWDSAPAGVFYRKDLFTAAGIDASSIKTWDDFIAAGKKVTKDLNGDGKPDQYMTLMSNTSDVSDMFQTLLDQGGGSEYNSQGQPTFNTPQALTALTTMKKIIDSGTAANIGWWTPEFFNGIKSGEIASLATGVWMGGQIKATAPDQSGKWAVMPLPAITAGGTRAAVRGGSNLAITAQSTKADAAWKFIEFALANKDSQLKMQKTEDIFPALKTAYSDPSYSTGDPYFGNQQVKKLFTQIQDTMPTNYLYGPLFLQANQILNTEATNALAGKVTPQQALDSTQSKISALMNQ